MAAVMLGTQQATTVRAPASHRATTAGRRISTGSCHGSSSTFGSVAMMRGAGKNRVVAAASASARPRLPTQGRALAGAAATAPATCRRMLAKGGVVRVFAIDAAQPFDFEAKQVQGLKP